MSTTLTLADLDTGGAWRPFDVPERLLADYRACTGWAGNAFPVGLLPVIGRLAYTDGKVMPPGGVLVEIELQVHGDLTAGPHQVRLGVQRLGERHGRARVRVRTSLARGDAPVADVDFLLDWPGATG